MKFIVFRRDEIEVGRDYYEHVALPFSWLRAPELDIVAEGLTREEAANYLQASRAPGTLLAPGSHFLPDQQCQNMDVLFFDVNHIYTLVDEGYVSGDKVIAAFLPPAEVESAVEDSLYPGDPGYLDSDHADNCPGRSGLDCTCDLPGYVGGR